MKKKCIKCSQVIDFANAPASGDTMACPNCGTANSSAVEASALACRALAALPELSADGSLPADIQLFPPGKDVPFTLHDHPGKDFLADVDAATATRLNDQLQTMIAQAAAGKCAKPYGDKNHEDSEATFHPTEIFWGGNDPKTGGVRIKTEWTGFGGPLVKAKAFAYASGNFLFSPNTKKIIGLLGENIASLVNRPGFSTIQAFAKADTSNKNQNQNKPMTDKEISDAIASGITAGLQPVITRIETLEASAKASNGTAVTAFETRLKNLETEKETEITAKAKATVAKAVTDGRIAGQDKEGVAWWEGQLVAEAKAGKSEAQVRLQKLPVNQAFLKVIAAAASGDAVANVSEPTAEGFVACVRAHAKAGKKKSEALDLAMVDNKAGYQAWRDANGQPGI